LRLFCFEGLLVVLVVILAGVVLVRYGVVVLFVAVRGVLVLIVVPGSLEFQHLHRRSASARSFSVIVYIYSGRIALYTAAYRLITN
jgi:hypothetical protein